MSPQPGAVELTDRRAWNAKHYSNPDGTFSGEFSPGSIHYRATLGGPWLDKAPAFRAGPGTAEWISDASDVTMRTFQTGTGGNARWVVEFKETLTGTGIQFTLSFQPTTTAGSNVLSFSDGAGGTWTYTHSRAGGKMLGPPTAVSKGPQTFQIPYALIGGAPALTLGADGSISCGNIFTMPRPYFQGADGEQYPASGWSINTTNQTLTFSYDDTTLPSKAYPYQIDPTTSFSVTAAGNDGYADADGTTWAGVAINAANSSWTSNFANTHKSFITPTYFVVVSEAKFDTSSLPDNATVTGADFTCYAQFTGNADSRNILAEWFPGYAGTTADWVDPVGSTAGTFPLSGITDAASNTLSLSNAAANVSLTGSTALRFGISGGQPTGANRFTWNTFEETTNPHEQLVVTYTAPGPSVRSVASGSGTGTVVSPTLPTGWAAGDIVGIAIAFQGGSGVTITTPSGWTLDPTAGRVDSTTAMSQAVFYRSMQAGDVAPTFTLGSSQKYVWRSVAVAPSSTSNPAFDKMSGQANVSSTAVSAPTLTPASNNALILYAGAVDTGTTFTPPTGYTEDTEVQSGAAQGGAAGAKTLYLMGGTLTNGMQPMQDGGTAPVDAAFATATGWVLGTTAAGNYAGFRANTERASTQFAVTVQPDTEGLVTGVTGNAFRSPTAYSGSFASGNWLLSAVLRSITAAAATTQTQRLRWRVYASVNADGTAARELTGAVQISGTVAGNGTITTNMTPFTATWIAPAITLANEYLFFVNAMEIVATAGTGNTRDANFRQNTNSAITTTAFTPALDLAGELAELTQTTAAATGTVSATAAVAAVNIGQLVSIINAPGVAVAQQVLTQTPPSFLYY